MDTGSSGMRVQRAATVYPTVCYRGLLYDASSHTNDVWGRVGTRSSTQNCAFPARSPLEKRSGACKNIDEGKVAVTEDGNSMIRSGTTSSCGEGLILQELFLGGLRLHVSESICLDELDNRINHSFSYEFPRGVTIHR